MGSGAIVDRASSVLPLSFSKERGEKGEKGEIIGLKGIMTGDELEDPFQLVRRWFGVNHRHRNE